MSTSCLLKAEIGDEITFKWKIPATPYWRESPPLIEVIVSKTQVAKVGDAVAGSYPSVNINGLIHPHLHQIISIKKKIK